jgi:hypothetical protein
MSVKLSIGHTPNYGTVTIGSLSLTFSYETVIAFDSPYAYGVSENAWGPTTGKHLNRVDGGTKEAKAARLSREAFEEKLAWVLEEHGL